MTTKTTKFIAYFTLIILVCSLLPLYIISFYNHPFYDDYVFAMPVHHTWLETHNIKTTLQVALDNVHHIRDTWQGTYTGTFFSNIQPGLFNENYYFICSLFLITTFTLGMGFFLWVLSRQVFLLNKSNSIIFSSLTLFLIIHFLPDVAEAFYWFNGGVGNIFIFSILFSSIALLIKLCKENSILKQCFISIVLFICVLLLGGGSYGGGLFGLCIYFLFVLYAFFFTKKNRVIISLLFITFLLLFIYNMTAPGNVLRANYIKHDEDALFSIVQALYYGTALIGNYFTLTPLALCILLLPLFTESIEKQSYNFSHPFLIIFLMGGLFCVPLVPTLFSGVFIGAGRIQNTYFINFYVFIICAFYYLVGFTSKRYPLFTKTINKNKTLILISASCIFLLSLTGAPAKRDELIGVQNLAGVSATVSLLTGEAESYHNEMLLREELLNDSSKNEITLSPISQTPDVFMQDLLLPDAVHNVVPTLKNYYKKDQIIVSDLERSTQ